MHTAQQPSYAERYSDGRIRLVLDGILQRSFKAAGGFAGGLRSGIVNVLRCISRIAGDACRIFLRFSNCSTEIWIGCAAFRHEILHRELVL
jgi:hypothetical protein